MLHKIVCCALILTISLFVKNVHNHGMLLEPINRGSLWRVDPSAVPDYDDDGANCGGLSVQVQNGGHCGVCGDNYLNPRPRAHELGGEFGQGGKIVATYSKGSVVDVLVKLTANHKGWFQFSVCDLSKNLNTLPAYLYGAKLPGQNFGHFIEGNRIDLEDSAEGRNSDEELQNFVDLEYQKLGLLTSETEECFKNITLADGSDLYQLTNFGPGNFTTQVKLPADLQCEHCVFRWHYRAGNNWGICPDGVGRDGCGPQETFVNCADIKIV